jgi:hypothetical protein
MASGAFLSVEILSDQAAVWVQIRYYPRSFSSPRHVMKEQLIELIGKISSGCLAESDILRIADEADRAYADPAAFLAANPDINYDDSFPMPLGEWVVVGSLPDTVLFQADSLVDLMQQIIESFGPAVSFNLKPKQLAKTEPATALKRIQVQMSALSQDRGGYTLISFSQLLDDAWQCVLVFGEDVERVQQLCQGLGINASRTAA